VRWAYLLTHVDDLVGRLPDGRHPRILDIGVSLQEYILGYLSASILGILVGLAVGWSRRLNYLASPWLAAWYATPHIALVPLVILWFGIGLWYKVFYVFLVAFFSNVSL